MAEKIIKTVKFLPEFLQTSKNTKFLASTLDQLIQKPQLEKLDGYVGSTRTPNFKPTDVYISESTELRSDYQLDPSLVVKDQGQNIKDVIGLNDLVNEIFINGGTVNDFDKLFRTEYYSYNPHIDPDKFVNYQNYYWLVNGAPIIDIDGSGINVDTDIIGEQEYTFLGDYKLLNGMKIRFTGNVTPITYQDIIYYVEGVGESIKLIESSKLKVSEKIAAIYDDSFDLAGFDEYPFDSYTRLPLDPEYITINRSGQDLNPWTRYNRWVHKDVIEISSKINGVEASFPLDLRARRPVIEFKPDIKLYNFGTNGIEPVDLIDDVTVDAFSIVEGSVAHYVDGELLQQGQRVIFTADNDLDVRGKIYEVNYIIIEDRVRLTLVEVYNPLEGDSIFVNLGDELGGTSWWYTGTEWKLSQQHTKLNQPPLFDLFDSDGNRYSDVNSYSSNFKGNKIFGYDVGTGTNDPILGFPLNYRNSIGVGSYLFKNYLTSDTITISNALTNSYTISTGIGFLKIGGNYVNAWKAGTEYPIPLVTSQLNTASTYYDLPLGLTNNPLNGSIPTLTLSDYRDHVYNATTSSEIRLISNVNPVPFALMFIGKKEHNLVDAVTKAADQYYGFKLAFIKQITDLSIETDPVRAVDEALKVLNVSKTTFSPYYLSDMVAYGDDYITKTYTVNNINVTAYPITNEFDLKSLSLRSVLVYLNGSLLLCGRDYTFADNDPYVEFLIPLALNDVIVIKDFTDTRGCYVPPTPSKLNLYPKYQPRIYIDDSYITPTKVIEGHDGSIMVAFDDYRDAVILEFEQRVYNNIKGEYRQELLDIQAMMPGAFRTTDYSQEEINKIIQQDFIKWTTNYGIDPTVNSAYNENNSYTWNYKGSYVSSLQLPMDGSWRYMFNYLYDTDRPDLYPWKMLGFVDKPSWWQEEYGAAPYLSTNTKLWGDLTLGRIRQGDRAGIHSAYARTGLNLLLPVDTAGNLEDPDIHVINITVFNTRQPWQFGNWGEAETAWRRSSYWPFVVQKILALTKPATYAALMYDPIRLSKNLSEQWIYGDNKEFLNLRNMPVQGLKDYPTSGYSAYVCEVGRQRNSNYNNELKEDLENLDINLFYKVGGFIDKSQFQISVDSYDPLSTAPGSVLQPEDYSLILNVSNPIRENAISGVIVQKTEGKFLVKGLDTQNPYFNIYTAVRSGATPAITVGGVSESYLTWAPSTSGGSTGLSAQDTASASSAVYGTYYQKGQFVKYGNSFYVVTIAHRSGAAFESDYFQKIPSLPIKGGATVQLAASFDKTTVKKVPYGTVYNTIQEVYDLIIGYGEWLVDQGFVFDQYNTDLQSTLDWNFTGKEFLYWTTQNWDDKSVIALSPFSDKLTYKSSDSVVDNIFNSFYEYSVLEASGQALPQKFLNVVRDEGRCEIKTTTPYRGIYFARLYSIQKEHAIVFNNRTIFNDSIYDIDTGYRQARVKLLGFRTANWNGDYFSPGFVYDTAVITDWKQYTDYKFQDVVKFNTQYYAAKQNLVGSATFDFDDWRLLGKKPVAALIPNFDYKISQFEDFYSLDTSNFDENQQRAAQNLIGYTPRVYLNNIFPDPISQYKFYQGFIREKGSRNSIAKLQRATVQNLNGKIDYNEEWAFRMGYYGAYSSYREIEFALEEGTFKENPQIVEFATAASTVSNLRITVAPNGVVIKPSDYESTQTFITTSESFEDVFNLTHAGYARFDDVDFSALNEDAILAFTSTDVIKEGQTIWLANTKLNDWTVLRKVQSKTKLLKVEVDPSTENQYNFTTDKPHGFVSGKVITVEEFDSSVNGIHRVNTVIDRDTFSVISTATVISDTLAPSNPGLIFVFEDARYDSFDNLPQDTELLRLPRNSKVWVDNNGENRWEVYQKIKNYKNYPVLSSQVPANQDLGYYINKQKSSVYMVGNPGFVQSLVNTGQVFVYQKFDNYSSVLFTYGINSSTTSVYDLNLPTGFGSSLFYQDKNFIDRSGPTGYGLFFAGAPLASKVRSTTLIEQGLIKISKVDADLLDEKDVRIITSPNAKSYERFGTSIFVADTSSSRTTLLVGAANTPTVGTGTVYRFVLSTSTVNTGTVDIVSTASIALGYSTVSRIDILNSGTNYKAGDVITITNTLASAPLKVRITKVNDSGSVRTFASPIDNSVVFATVPGSLINSPSLSVNTGSTGTGLAVRLVMSAEVGSQWGYSIAGSSQDSFNRGKGVVAIGAPGFSSGKGFVVVYSQANISLTTATASQYLVSPFENNSNFGWDISVSPTGSYIFVSAINARSADQSYGRVAVYYRDSSTQTFTLTQVISNPVSGVGMKFGQSIDIAGDEEELVISALGTNRRINVTFDDYTRPLVTDPDIDYDNDPNSDFSPSETSYDIDSTYFIDRIVFSGSVYVYNRKNRLFKAADELPPVDISAGTNYGFSVSINDNNILVGAPAVANANNTTTNSAFYQFYKIDPAADSWKLLRYQEDLVKTDSVQKITLIDVQKEEVVDYLEIVDPLKGKIIGIAEQELSYKLSYDPAVYSVGTGDVVVDLNTNWTTEHIGDLWWDLSTAKYPWYEQGEAEYRKNNWGVPFPGSTIDVYEWVETTLLPSQWAALANTTDGLAQGISGEPKFADNSNLSVRQVYNKISGTFSNYYYYWVKNSTIVPDAKNRRISALQVAALIENPKNQGVRYLEILAADSLAIANSANLLVGNRVHLNIVSDEINNTVPKHTEWLLLQEGSEYSSPPKTLESKMLDSITGTDDLGNPVPDPALSARERYGISIRPKQSMFKDRLAALRNIIEYANGVLIDQRVTGVYSFENLNKQEQPPGEDSNEYDQVVEDTVDLESIVTEGLETAELSCTVSNGKIISVSIVGAGYGYKVAPTVEIENNKHGAKLVTTIDALGRITSVSIVDGGKQFATAPALKVRPYSVLVLADSTYNGNWTIFVYDNADVLLWRQNRGYYYGQKVKYNNNFYSAKYDISIGTAFNPEDWTLIPIDQAEGRWVRSRTQLYNTPYYWDYVDWSSENYDRYKDYAYTVNSVSDLSLIETEAEDYVKVKNNGLGNFIILEKVATGEVGTFDSEYNIVYSEKGTIQISDDIWNYQTGSLGFDQNTYDQTLYDQTPDLELHYILAALKDDIFVGDLKVYWNKLFFQAVRYALTEQKFLDWAFKTSFINVTNYAGELRQLPVYKLADTKFYENYILEAKPYHTQIRNFTTNHTILDTSNAYTTDFDLPPVYDPNSGRVITVNSGSAYLSQYPWKSWAQNYGSTDTVRINQITLKYDRVSRTQQVDDLDVVDTFIGDGIRADFELSWLAQPDIDAISVFLGNNKVLSSDYEIVYFEKNSRYEITKNITAVFDNGSGLIRIVADDHGLSTGDTVIITNVQGATEANGVWIVTVINADTVDLQQSGYKSSYISGGILRSGFNSYLKQYSKLVLTAVIPEPGQKITVNYKKNSKLLNAVDRTLAFYEPTDEMPGKDLAQLMVGMEYPQTNLEGISLNYSTRWGDTEIGFDGSAYEDELSFYTFTTSTAASTNVGGFSRISLFNVTGIQAGQTLNIISTTTSYFTMANAYDAPKVKAVNTASKYIDVNKLSTTVIPTGAKIEFWTYNENPSILDTQYSGGDFSYIVSTETGAIIIDGDKFVSPNTSYGPEELVPGEVYESVGINVYTKAPIQSPIIVSSSLDIIETYTTTTRALTVVPSSPAAIIVSYPHSVVTATLVQTAALYTTTLYLSTTSGFKSGDPLYIVDGVQQGTVINSLTGFNGVKISLPITQFISSGTVIQAIKPNSPTIFEYVPYTSTGTQFNNADQFTVDWSNDDGRHPLLMIAPQAREGKLAYTVVDVGAVSTNNQTGFVDSGSAVTDNVDRVEIESLGGYGTVKSAYVTVNGNSIPVASTGSFTFFELTYANEQNKRAAVKVWNLPEGTNVTSAWFFGTEQKLWNEIKEEIKVVPRFTKKFTALATNGSTVIANVSDLSGLRVGSGVYARSSDFSWLYTNNVTTITNIVGNTITLSAPINFGPFTSPAIIEFGIELPGYAEISTPGLTTFAATITNVSNASPAVVTTVASHRLSTATSVLMSGVQGLSNIFNDNTGVYYVSVLTPTTFSLYRDKNLSTPVNTSAASAYNPLSAASVLVLNNTTIWNSTFTNPVGNIEPQVANTIVEFENYDTGARRMLIAPQINYYSVDDVNNNVFVITNKKSDGSQNPLTINEIRVYLNGNELRRGFDFIFYSNPNSVKIDRNIISVGDVVAILNKPGSVLPPAGGNGEQDYEYDVYNNNLLLCTNNRVQVLTRPNQPAFNSTYAGWHPDWRGEIKIITYNNYDNQLMRTETFDGNPSGRYKISRPVLDESYVWVYVNGNPLANYVDFEILDDAMTVQITDAYALTNADVVTIISFSSNKTTADILGFRIFNDFFNRYHYKRLSKENSTELSQSLTDADSLIYVKDSSVLTRPIVEENIPGVVIVNGERIEFFKTYSVVNNIEILDPGLSFRTFDTVTFSGPNWIVPLVAVVTVNTNGSIVSLTFSGGVYDGFYIEPPTTFTATSQDGVGATFRISLTENAVLGQLRRGTLGTSPKVYCQSNTTIIDQGGNQTIPYSDRILKQNILTTESVNVYSISTSSFNYYWNTDTNSTSTWINDGIKLSTINSNPANQLEVYYGGRRLNKGFTYYQDPNIAYDNQDIRRVANATQILTTATTDGLPPVTASLGTAYVVTATNQVWVYENSLEEGNVAGYVYKGLMRQDPEFTLNTSTQQITLNIEGGVEEGIRLTFVKREFRVSTLWNNNGVSLLDSDSNPAKFLRARPAELPDDQYYGGDFELQDNTGEALTDDQGNPLTGIN